MIRGATLVRRKPTHNRHDPRHLWSGTEAHVLDAPGHDNGALSVHAYGRVPAWDNGYRVEAPRSIQSLRGRRFTPYPALWASLETYYSCSQPYY